MKTKKKYFEVFNRINIETRMTFAYVILFFSIFFTLFIFTMVNAIKLYKLDIEASVNEVVNSIVSHIESGGAIDHESILDLIRDKDIQVTIFKNPSSNFEPTRELPNALPERFSYASEQERPDLPFIPLSKNPIEGSKFVEISGTRYIYAGRKIEYDGELYFIQVFKNSITEDNYIRNFYIICIIANVIGLFSSYFISKLINRRFLKGIKNISKTAENIRINGLSQRIKVPKTNDEISELTITINDMLDRIEVSVISQNQFISDVSHELRTPIAVIKGYADLISRWGKDDITILEESIEAIKNEAEHMTNLIKKLMFLDRGREFELNKKSIFLNEMVDEICKDVKIITENIQIDMDFKEEIYISGDEDLIKQMIWIFMDNAIKYSSRDTPKILINLYKDSEYNFISIKDNGKGIAKDDLPFIFDRFYRGDKSRSKKIGGTGLGLSIARLIAEKHEGKIEVESELDKGSLFTIKLPIKLD